MSFAELRDTVNRLRAHAIEHDALFLLPGLAVLDELVARAFRYRDERDKARGELARTIAERDQARRFVVRMAAFLRTAARQEST